MKTYTLKVSCANGTSVGRFVDALVSAGADEVSYVQQMTKTAFRTTVPSLARAKPAPAASAEPTSMADVIEQYFADRGKGVAVHVAKDEGLALALKKAGYATRPDTAVHSVMANYHLKLKKVAPATYAYTG